MYVRCLRHGIPVWHHIDQSTTATSRHRRDMIYQTDVQKRGYVKQITKKNFHTKGHPALERNQGPGYNTLLLRLIADLYSAYPHRQLLAFTHSLVALPNSFPNACLPSRNAICTIFMMVFGMARPGANPKPTALEANKLTFNMFKSIQTQGLI